MVTNRRATKLSKRTCCILLALATIAAMSQATWKAGSSPVAPVWRRTTLKICFASHEIKCFTKNAGGLGRAFFEQAVQVQRLKYEVKLILLEAAPVPGSTLVNLCPDDLDAVTLAQYAVLPVFNGADPSAFPFYHAPMQLLNWLEENSNACDILHVADFLGEGAMVTLAKRAGLRSMQALKINVQVHGSDSVILHETSLAIQRFHLYIHALERLQMNLADSVVFLTDENAKHYEKFWDVPSDVTVIPNIVKIPPGQRFPSEVERRHIDVRHIIFYGKMTEAKGLKIFLEAVALCAPEDVQNITVHLIGMRFDEQDHLESLRSFAYQYGLTLAAEYNFNTWDCIQFLHRHRYNGVAVIPSYVEHQSFALFDVFLSQISFLASDIEAHRSQIPSVIHDQVLFNLTPKSLSARLTTALREGVLTNSNTPAWVPTGKAENLWKAWYNRQKINGAEGHSREKKHRLERRFTVAIMSCDQDRWSNINRALMSIAAQAYPLQLIDVLVIHYFASEVSPCSQMSSLSKLEQASLADLHVRCIDGTSNRTVTRSRGWALNLAVKSAQSTSVLLIDDTDQLTEHAIASFALALNHNRDTGVFTSFVDVLEPSHQTSHLHDQNLRSHKYFIPSLEVGMFENTLGEAHMLINKASPFWVQSDGFITEPSVGCEDWSMLQRAAMVDELVLVPQTLVLREMHVNDVTGWSTDAKKDKHHIQNVRCRTKVMEDVTLFAAAHPDRVDLRKFLTPFMYSHALHSSQHAK